MFDFLKEAWSNTFDNTAPGMRTENVSEETLKEQSPFVQERATIVQEKILPGTKDGTRAVICLIGEELSQTDDNSSVAAAIMIEGNGLITVNLLVSFFRAHPELFAATKAMLKPKI